MDEMNSNFGETQIPRTRVGEVNNNISYFIRETRAICQHLEKLDRLPLDNRFDCLKYFDKKEFVYSGDPEFTSTQVDIST